MVRDLMMHEGKIAPADCKAVAAVATGCGVVIDFAAKTFAVPSAETADNIFVVHKERILEGVYASLTDVSDYFEQFHAIKEGEYAPLYSYDFGEMFAVDAYATALVDGSKGKYVSVGTDGKWQVAGSSVASKYKFVDWFMDNGHKLAKIVVCDAAGTNS